MACFKFLIFLTDKTFTAVNCNVPLISAFCRWEDKLHRIFRGIEDDEEIIVFNSFPIPVYTPDSFPVQENPKGFCTIFIPTFVGHIAAIRLKPDDVFYFGSGYG
jgi:hypothetical protein